jgi:hypothetical protein
MRGSALAATLALSLATGCSTPPDSPDSTSAPATQETTVSEPAPGPSPSTATTPPTTTTPATSSPTPTLRTGPSLAGDTANTWAFAPVDDPEALVVEGSVTRQRAWSTSKVLVAAAFLEDAVGGDPTSLDDRQRRWIELALSESDMESLLAMRRAISGDRGARMTAILRSVGDERTVAPSDREGTMLWRVEDQVLFMAALARGEVVSPATSAYLLEAMQPVQSQSWGLGDVGATAVKGGWLTPTTETRQMGLLNGYAVAVVTDAVGPAVLQSDGDEAHVEQLDRLAAMLAERLGAG